MEKEEKDNKGKVFLDNTPLYPRMTKVCHVLMFLYGAAYWIQIGVFPVRIYDHHITFTFIVRCF